MDLLFDSTRFFVRSRWPDRDLVQVDLLLDDGKMIRLPLPEGLGVDVRKTRITPGIATLNPERELPLTASHSADFRSLHWFGTDYFLTQKQSQVVKVLWEAREKGSPDVSRDLLLRACDSDGVRLVDLFRRSPAWGTIIVSVQRGTYRLPEPPENI